MLDALPFREIWAVDFEFGGGAGNRPDPVCVVRLGITERSQASTMARRVRPFPAVQHRARDVSSLHITRAPRSAATWR